MKSLETLISEKQTALTAKGIDFKEAVTGCTSSEQRLSKLTQLADKHNIRESRPRVTRNNGTGVHDQQPLTETDKIVLTRMKQRGCSFREAALISGLPDPGVGAPLTKSIVESLVAEWKAYLVTISDTDALTLAQRGIRP